MGLGKKRYLDIWTADKIGCKKSVAGRTDIEDYTDRQLRETLRYAIDRSPFYRELLGENGDVKACLDDRGRSVREIFGTLPFTTPEDLRTRETELLCVRPNEISRIVTLGTGGSTGKPKRVYFTDEDQQLTVDYFQNGMQLIVDSSDKVLILMPAEVPGSIGKLLGRGLRNFGAETVEYGLPGRREGEAEHLLELMSGEGVTSAVALPTHMKMLAEEYRNSSRKYKNINIRSVLLSAEYISEQDVKIIEETFGCRVYEHYGMTEMGLGCAVSCGQGEGYHIRESDLYIEIIDPVTGEIIEDERPGEVVFTTLNRRGMPFIRYRTGDFTRWINEPCPCGSVLKRIAKVGPREAVKGYLK